MFGADASDWTSPYEDVAPRRARRAGRRRLDVTRTSRAFQDASGMTAARRVHGALRGFGSFGDITVPYTDATGVTASAAMDTSANCGDVFGVQQALKDLGYNVGPVDGKFGAQTTAALREFAQNYGVAYTGGEPSGAVCQQLEDTWTASRGLPTPPSPTYPPAPGASPAPSGGISAWWSAQSTPTQVLVVGGAALALGLVGYALLKKPGHHAPAHA